MSAATVVYLLCLLTSSVCGFLLIRRYLQHRTRLLLWCAACFVLLAINNLMIVLDLIVFPTVDLTVPRSLASLVGVSSLLYGFIWELD